MQDDFNCTFTSVSQDSEEISCYWTLVSWPAELICSPAKLADIISALGCECGGILSIRKLLTTGHNPSVQLVLRNMLLLHSTSWGNGDIEILSRDDASIVQRTPWMHSHTKDCSSMLWSLKSRMGPLHAVWGTYLTYCRIRGKDWADSLMAAANSQIPFIVIHHFVKSAQWYQIVNSLIISTQDWPAVVSAFYSD